jgi:hypothetical protein
MGVALGRIHTRARECLVREARGSTCGDQLGRLGLSSMAGVRCLTHSVSLVQHASQLLHVPLAGVVGAVHRKPVRRARHRRRRHLHDLAHAAALQALRCAALHRHPALIWLTDCSRLSARLSPARHGTRLLLQRNLGQHRITPQLHRSSWVVVHAPCLRGTMVFAAQQSCRSRITKHAPGWQKTWT